MPSFLHGSFLRGRNPAEGGFWGEVADPVVSGESPSNKVVKLESGTRRALVSTNLNQIVAQVIPCGGWSFFGSFKRIPQKSLGEE